MTTDPAPGLEIPWVEALSCLVRERLGYAIPPHRMIREIAPFAVAEAELLGFGDPADLVASLRAGTAPDPWRALVDLVTIGETYFFRHPEQIEALVRVAKTRYDQVSRPLRIWSAGCATGEEAWTIAMYLEREHIPCRITASDVSREALARASGRGPYSDRSVGHLSSDLRDAWIRADSGRGWRVAGEDELVIEVRHHNLVEDPALRTAGDGWDFILCRNVLLYFEAEAGGLVLEELGRTLAAGGSIWIAPCDHASVAGLALRWRYEGRQRYLGVGGEDGLPPRPAAAEGFRAGPAPAAPPRSWAEEVEALLERGLFTAAQDVVVRRLHASPEAGRALVARAAFHLRAHEFDLALEELEKAERAHPRPEGLAYLQGIALLKTGREQEALRAFLRAVEDDPDDWASSWHAADLYRRRGRTLHEELMLRRTVELLGQATPDSLSFGPAARVVNSVHLDPLGVREQAVARLASRPGPVPKRETST